MPLKASTPLKIGVYTPDSWEHVCPQVRFVGPAQVAGVELIRGAYWEAGEIKIFPEIVWQVDAVLVVRDFPRYFDALQKIMDLAEKAGKPILYELDDLLLWMPDEHPDYAYYLAGRADALQCVRRANAVIGSTPQICDYLRLWNPQTWLFSNYLNDQIWPLNLPQRPPSQPEATPVVIGYMGGHSHKPDLEMIAPVLRDVCLQFGEQVHFKFFGIQPPPEIRDLNNVEILEPALISYADFVQYFTQQTIDIFIAPLKDTVFNRGKSHLKFLEYSAFGVPGVYSRVAPYESIVAHGQNGFLADSPEAWLEALSALIEDSQLRWQIGQRAFEMVRTNWLLSDHAQGWVEIFEQARTVGPKSTPFIADQKLVDQLTAWYRETSEQIAQTRQLQEKTKYQAMTIQNLELHAENLTRQKQQAEDLIQEIRHSRGWLLLEKMRALRLRWAPRGSWRERVFLWMFESFRILRKQGLKAWLRHARHKTQGIINAVQQPGPVLRATLTAASPKAAPLCSVVILRGAEGPAADEQQVADWCRAQTCYPLVELVVWDQPGRQAWIEAEPSRTWEAPNLPSLIAGLGGAHLCLASPDLLQQSATYLETNLIALECEELVFTVNLRGHTPWVEPYFERGLLPGNFREPLLRQVVRVENLRDGFSLDLTAALQKSGGRAALVGRVIVQTSNHPDAENSLPFETSLPEVDLKIHNRRILARQPGLEAWDRHEIGYPLHPVDGALPLVVVPDARPTVILVQTVLAVGGAERVHLDMMHYLKDAVRFVVLTGEPMDVSLGTTAEAHRAITPYVYTAPDYLDWHLNLSHLVYLIERFQPEVLYFANGVNWMYDILPDLKRRYPHLRMGNQVYDAVEGWITRYQPELTACFEAHIGVNKKIGRAFAEHGAPLEHIYVIPNGVATDEYDPALYSERRKQIVRSKLGIPAHKKVVTFISRVAPQKRPMDFVELARRLAQDPSLVFVMVGDGPLAETVDAEIRRIGLKNIIRHSFYSPSSDVFAVSDVLVLPSEYEGMPMVILEAQAMGVPVVVTDVGNNQEVVGLTHGGVIIPQIGDVAALAGGVQMMTQTPPDPEAVRQAVLEHFSLAKMGEDYRRALLG